MSADTLPADTVAEAFLGLMKTRGIDYLFTNAGTDTAPLIEGMVNGMGNNMPMPTAMVVPHENAAMGMAHGYYLISRKPQAVMVHVTVGTANALCNLMNASRENIPMLFAAGRTPLYEDGHLGARNVVIHWGQEMFDQAGMLREFVKWDYELKGASQVESVVDRAMAIMKSQPTGPVYLSLPREILASKMDGVTVDAQNTIEPTSPPYPDPGAVNKAADILAHAKNPAIVTLRAGRNPEAKKVLEDFAEAFAMPVVEYRARYLSMSSDHPMHMGYDYGHALSDAEPVDAVLVLDTDAPWTPGAWKPGPDVPIIHMGPDPLFINYPLRGFRNALGITTDVAAGLKALHDALETKTKGSEQEIKQRFEKWSAAHNAWRAKFAKMVAETPGKISKPWISHAINEIKDDDSIVITEPTLVLPVMNFSEPNTYFAAGAAGGLGWAVPAAVGAKLAAKDKGEDDRLVICAVGDGSYQFANPVTCHHVAEANGLPFLTVVVNNQRWDAVHFAVNSVYPKGTAVKANEMPLTSLKPSPDYEKIVEACGGVGFRVEDPAELIPTLEKARAAVLKEKKQAVVNVVFE